MKVREISYWTELDDCLYFVLDTTVLINVAMTTPWNMMDQLQNWASLLQDHIDKLRLTAEQVRVEKSRHFNYFLFCCKAYTFLSGERSASSFVAALAALHRAWRRVGGGKQSHQANQQDHCWRKGGGVRGLARGNTREVCSIVQ